MVIIVRFATWAEGPFAPLSGFAGNKIVGHTLFALHPLRAFSFFRLRRNYFFAREELKESKEFPAKTAKYAKGFCLSSSSGKFLLCQLMFLRQIVFLQHILPVFIAFFPPDGMYMIGIATETAVVEFDQEGWSVQYEIVCFFFGI